MSTTTTTTVAYAQANSDIESNSNNADNTAGSSTVRRRSSALAALPRIVELSSTAPRRRSYALVSSSSTSLSEAANAIVESPASDALSVRPPADEPDVSDDDDDHSHPHSHSSDEENNSVGLKDYIGLLRRYPMYRAYFISHVCQNLGDWFVRIASILVVQEFSNTGQAVAHLALCSLLPRAIFSNLGGVLADRFDRRVGMIVLDLLSGFVVLGYLAAIHWRNLNVLYVVTILRSTLGATYYPITTGIVPMLVPKPHDLQLAATMNSFAWSVSSIVGGLLAGELMSHISFTTCYWIDSITFFISAAWVYWGISGSFTVHNAAAVSSETGACSSGNNNPLCSIFDNFAQVAKYLWGCGFGMMVFQQCSASFVWGIEDIVGAKFSTVFNADGTEQEDQSSWHMGLLFSVVGAGCLAGPVLVNFITDARSPHTLQRACWIGFCFLTVGWLLISTAHSFHAFLSFTFIRVMGSGIAYVNATLLLQRLCEPAVLGRVLAVSYTLVALLEASSAAISGALADGAGFSKNQLALFGASLGFAMVVFWGVYYWVLKAGAADPRFNTRSESVEAGAAPSTATGYSGSRRSSARSSYVGKAFPLELDIEVP